MPNLTQDQVDALNRAMKGVEKDWHTKKWAFPVMIGAPDMTLIRNALREAIEYVEVGESEAPIRGFANPPEVKLLETLRAALAEATGA